MATSPVPSVAQQPTPQAMLFVAFALSLTTWKLGCTPGSAQRPRERSVPARDIAAVQQEMTSAKQRFGLAGHVRGVSGYEAGRDGLWLHRWLVAQGVEHVVVASSSMAVHRRHRRAKTDRLALHKVLTMLLRPRAGAKRVWRVVRVPRGEEEDRRHLHRA
jgi:transposase